MAAVDASVGIKTAVNFDNRKNKMGTYCPPLAVYIDRCATSSQCRMQSRIGEISSLDYENGIVLALAWQLARGTAMSVTRKYSLFVVDRNLARAVGQLKRSMLRSV